ncbi:MAG: RNA polymerase sigma factor [Pirellulaceae bacterium]|nr:MAG: RNA polymerase sigma factor [Pirellulaceae bacterium]
MTCQARGSGGQRLSVSDSTAQRYQMADPDVRLMLRVRDGDVLAFEELVKRYQNRLLTLLEHVTASRDQAEDLAQEVFLRLFRARRRYQPGARFSTFLFTIAHNVASNAVRRQSRRREVQVDSPGNGNSASLDEMAVAKSGFMPARQLDKAERAEFVRAAINQLSDRQRMALMLCKFEGLSYAEIGQIMGLSEKAVKSLLARARQNLRAALEPYILEGKGTLRKPDDESDADNT